MILELTESQSKELEDLFVLVSGEENRISFRNDIALMFKGDPYYPTFFVKKLDDKIIAVIAMSDVIFSGCCCALSKIVVHPSFQKQGIGTEIVQYCLKEIHKRKQPRGATAILSCYAKNAPFYERFGFSGDSLDHEGDPIMTLSLN